MIEPGFYRHFKGGVYVVYGNAMIDDLPHVVYKPRTTSVDKANDFYVRPEREFFELVTRPRFISITAEEAEALDHDSV